MARPVALILAAAAVLGGALVLVWRLSSHAGAPASSAAGGDAPASDPGPVASGPQAPVVAQGGTAQDGAGAAAPGQRTPGPRPAVPAREREQEIRRRVNATIDQAVLRVTDIRCHENQCRVELEATDLTKAGPGLERLQEPGTGFVGEARQLRLEAPVALGASGGGPWRLAFSLEY